MYLLDIALDFMQRRPDRVGMRKTLILSDISQSGMPREQLYTQVAEMVNRRGVDRLIGVGPDLSAMQGLLRSTPPLSDDESPFRERKSRLFTQ